MHDGRQEVVCVGACEGNDSILLNVIKWVVQVRNHSVIKISIVMPMKWQK